MKFISSLKLTLICLTGALACISAAQLPTGPNTMKPADLPDGYKAMEIKTSGMDSFDLMGSSMFMLQDMGSGSGTANGPDPKMMQAITLYWTKNEWVTLWSNHAYLVAYKVDLPSMVARAGAAREPSLVRTLINTDQIVSVVPRDDISKADFLSMLGLSASGTQTQDAQIAALRTLTLSNAKQLALATIMFASDNDDVLPYSKSSRGAMKAIMPYIKDNEVIHTKNPNGGWFQYNMSVSGVSDTAAAEPSNTPLFYDSKEWPDGRRVVAFLDGHAKVVSKEDWAGMQKYLNLSIPRTGKPLPPDYGAELDIGH
jgi:hypothetical protein